MAKPALVVLVLAYLAFVSLGLPDTVLGVAWPSLQAAFHISPSSLGALLASGLAGYFLTGLFAGEAVARLPRGLRAGRRGATALGGALEKTYWKAGRSMRTKSMSPLNHMSLRVLNPPMRTGSSFARDPQGSWV